MSLACLDIMAAIKSDSLDNFKTDISVLEDTSMQFIIDNTRIFVSPLHIYFFISGKNLSLTKMLVYLTICIRTLLQLELQPSPANKLLITLENLLSRLPVYGTFPQYLCTMCVKEQKKICLAHSNL